jgi:MFS family permease
MLSWLHSKVATRADKRLGLMMGGWYALAGTTSITQMFDVHERGLRVGIWNFAVLVSVNFAPVISGKVIVSLSWRWSFWLLAITFGVLLFFTIFFFPETSTKGGAACRARSVENCEEGRGFERSKESTSNSAGTSLPETTKTRLQPKSHPASTWKRFLALDAVSSGAPSQALAALIAPLSLLGHPVAIWGYLMWSVTFTWVIIQGAVADQIWGAPPYNLSPSAVGNLVGIAPLIGSALGCLLGGAACDVLSRAMAKKNNNVYEPESRLMVIALALPTCVAGGFGLGESIERGMSAIVTAVFLAILNFGVGVGCTGIVSYTNDTFQERAGEAFGLAMMAKSAFAFGISFELNEFYAARGPRVFFFTWGGLTIAVMLLTIPMYVWGRRIRSRWQRKSVNVVDVAPAK